MLIHNQLADKAKARLPTFSHNLHLAAHHIYLTLNNILQITTRRLFDSIQFCAASFLVTHRIILWAPLPLLFLLIIVSQNVILSVKTRLLPDKLLIFNNLSVRPHLFTDKLSILSQLYSCQRHSPRRIAKHLSRAGFCRRQCNLVTLFLQKNLVSICVIAFDVNFIEDRKSVAIGDFWTNEHPDKPKNIHITNWYPIDYVNLKQNINMLIPLFFMGVSILRNRFKSI